MRKREPGLEAGQHRQLVVVLGDLISAREKPLALTRVEPRLERRLVDEAVNERVVP